MPAADNDPNNKAVTRLIYELDRATAALTTPPTVTPKPDRRQSERRQNEQSDT